MKKVLVIGGAGFIGMNIVKELKKNNIKVGVYDLVNIGIGDENYFGDLVNDKEFSSILSNYDAVIYLITTVSPKKSMDEPALAYSKDIPLLIKTLEECLKNGIKRVIFASSGGAIYGETNGLSAKESHEKHPINNYAICKLACENVLNMYNTLYGMENISLRISNPYGMGQRPESGVGVITNFVDKACKKETLKLYGVGDTKRDFIDVAKVAQAFNLALNYEISPNVEPIFNIGSGQAISLKQVINIIEDVLQIKCNITFFPERDFDVKTSMLDISKAIKYLNYSPNINEEENIKQYVLKMSENYTKR